MAPDPLIEKDDGSNNNIKDPEGADENENKTEEPETMPLWGSCRLFVAIIGALVMSSSQASQASMTSAMVCMIEEDNNHHHKDHNNSSGDGDSWKYTWDSETQGWIVSSFFFGYFFMQIPSGIIVTKIGPKGCMTFGLIATGVLHLISIPTAGWSLPALYAVRTVAGLTCGFMFPGIFALVANWCPRHETSVMFALPCLGFEFGNSFIFLVSLFGCEWGFQGGWPVVFYTLGAAQIVVGLVMFFFITDFPASHRCIGQKEAKYIAKYRVHEEKATDISYGKILRSGPVWAFVMGQFAVEYAYYTIITQGPVFLKDILRLPHWKINMISSVPFLAVTPMAFMVGYVSDKLVARKIISTTGMRKSNESISKILIAVSLGILSLMPVGEFVSVFFIYMVAGIGIQFCYIGFMANPGDLSPAHAGFLAGLGQALTTWVSFVIPVLTGKLASGKNREGWYVIFFVAVGLQAACLVIFLLFGSGNLQPWATETVDEKIPIVNKNEEKDTKKRVKYRTLSL